MHLMIPHASALDEAARHALAGLNLPHLAALLSRLSPAGRWGSDEFAPHPPHDLALAALRGQTEPSTAAWAAGDTGDLAWGMLTPVHLAVGTDGVDMLPPAALRLGESDAARLVATLRQLWPDDEGWQWRVLDASTWLIGHASALDGLEAASIERVAGQAIEPWLPESRTLRRWQNEAQMLLHEHALNTERAERGELVVNSIWISGLGRAGGTVPQVPQALSPVQIDRSLSAPLLQGDLAGWVEAWQRLDAGPLARLSEVPGAVSLTLAGERFAQTWTAQPLGWTEKLRRRWRAAQPSAVLEAL